MGALISDAIESWLENDSSPASKFAAKILNTEGWKGSNIDDEFCFNAINKPYEFHKIPLEWAGFTGTISELLEQWQSLCNYTIKYLSPETT